MHANKPQPGLSEKAPGPGLSEHGLRTVLLLAFGGLLALMLVASVSALLSLRQLHAVEQQVASRFLSRTQALSEVVISVHIYDDQLAEFLLDDRAVELRESGPEIAERAAKVHSALRRYPSDGGPRERQLLESLSPTREHFLRDVVSYSGRSQDAIPEVYPGAAPTAQLEHSPGFATNCLPEWPGACQKQPGSSGEVRFAAIQAQVHASCRFDGRASAVTPRELSMSCISSARNGSVISH